MAIMIHVSQKKHFLGTNLCCCWWGEKYILNRQFAFYFSFDPLLFFKLYICKRSPRGGFSSKKKKFRQYIWKRLQNSPQSPFFSLKHIIIPLSFFHSNSLCPLQLKNSTGLNILFSNKFSQRIQLLAVILFSGQVFFCTKSTRESVVFPTPFHHGCNFPLWASK